MGQRACAITDHGNVSGTYKFFKSCRKHDIKPVLGMEAYYTVNDRGARELDEMGSKYYHLVLLAQNNVGLKNLFKLSSRAYSEGMYYKPRIDDELIAEHNEGIIATSACLGSRASKLILSSQISEAERLLDHHAQIFKDRFFIEVQLHEGKDQQTVNQELIRIAGRKGFPLLLSNDCHYTHENDKEVHELSLCMQSKSVMSDPPWNPEAKGEKQGKTRFSFGDIDVHVATHDWMWERAKQQGIPYEAIANTRYIANLVEDNTYFADRKNRYPTYEELPEGIPSWGMLEQVAKRRLTEKMGGRPPKVYQDRINSELSVIKKMGFSDYLLIVWEFLNGARSEDVWIGPGRGSAAGSLVAYALDITQIDPIKYNLVFHRWLNYGRSATPMLLDKQMIKQIEEQHGRNNHTDTCTEHCANNCGSHSH